VFIFLDMKKRVVIGFVGTRLDAGASAERWKKWRPTVALTQEKDFFIDRLILIHDKQSRELAELLIEDIAEISPGTSVEPHVLNLRDPWDFGEVYGKMLDFAKGMTFDPDTEDYFVNITTGTHVVQICWFLLAEARFVPAQILQLSPPAPRNRGKNYSIIDLDLSKYDAIATRFDEERETATAFLKRGIATRSPLFNAMIDQIENIAIRSTAPILLQGPTGAGKSQLARRIFELKKSLHKVKGNFVEVNCATLRGDQAMSTLFGHVKGAFTGAMVDRAGLLATANNGVLFLDEIGELGADEQAMCLRAIEDKTFLRVGSDKETSVTFQLIAGTNRDLTEAVRKGRFRDDLLARINLWSFELPALRERPEDIEPNLDYELKRLSDREGQSVSFNKEARQNYLNFATSDAALWSSNFRDLSASVTRMATLAPSGRIDVATVQNEIATLKRMWRGVEISSQSNRVAVLVQSGKLAALDRFDEVQLEDVLRVCEVTDSISEAGRKLFAQSRAQKSSTNDADRLRKYLSRFELNFDDVKRAFVKTQSQ
jgi:transcriptional regulatory protein RtcR